MRILPMRKGIAMLTSACNLSCEYCFETHCPKHMTLEMAKQTVDYLCGNCKEGESAGVVFFGGEPMLMFDPIIVPLLEYSKSLDLHVNFTMTTNGTLLTREKFRYLNDNNVRFMLSFDGLKDVQESGRPMKNGKSSYDLVIDNLRHIQESGVFYTVRSTLHRSWIDRLFETIQFMDSLNVPTYHLLPNVWETWDEQDLKTLQEQLAKYEEYVIDGFRSGRKPLLFTDYSAGFWRMTAAMRNPLRRSVHSCLPESRCGMGVRGSCSIDPSGDMYGCHHISPMTRDSAWYIGNVYDGVDEKRVQNLIAMYDKDVLGNSHCKSCPLDGICDGGCTPTNVMVTGNVNEVPETFCLWRRAITDSAYRVAQILGAEENTLFRTEFLRWC